MLRTASALKRIGVRWAPQNAYLFIEGVTPDEQRRKLEKYKIKCYFNPFYRDEEDIDNKLLDYVCFVNYYLVLKKFQDNYSDEKNILYRILFIFLKSRNRYKEKSVKYSRLTERLDDEFLLFAELEKKSDTSFDELAASMGRVIENIVGYYLEQEKISNEEERRKAIKLNFHVGEWIYLLDALDDYDDDLKRRRYNPLFQEENDNNQEQKKQEMRRGFFMSGLMVNEIREMNHNISYYTHREILENILEISLEKSVSKIFQSRFIKYVKEDNNEYSL